MSARDQILGKVRAALAGSDDAARRRSVAARLRDRPDGLVPERASRPATERLGQLQSFLEGQAATYIEVGERDEVPGAIADYLRLTNLPSRLRMGDDPYLAELAWGTAPQIERRPGRAAATDEVGLSHAVAAVAETGTLVLASGASNPVTVTFMPETHIVVVEAGTVVGGYEEAWRMVRDRFGAGALPRTVNMVSGPSRTGDIGGQLVMGAHGPRRLCVIVVRET